VTRDRRAGMTLIEIVVVVAIIGVLSAMAVPAFITWQRNERVKEAARAVGDAFEVARSEAIRTGNNYLVVLANALGAPQPIVIVNDGPPAAATCTIGANKIVSQVNPIPGVSWGTSVGNANGTAAPLDTGLSVTNIPNGSSFSDASLNPSNPATWVLFQSDGIPRLFTANGGTCSAIGSAGSGGGAIYVTNGQRDYAVVLRALGTIRVHRWRPSSAAWSS
jgi:prepilin-type N-terminal cleavage/methylation domain-containing protein